MKTEQQLVMDRPAIFESRQQATAAGIKTILFHVNEDDSMMDRLQLALDLARACGAHLHCLHVVPIEAYMVVDIIGGTFVSEDIVRALEEQAQSLRNLIEEQLRKEDVSWDYEEITGELAPHLVQSAALSDLVITGREPRQRDFGGPAITLLGDLLFAARTPLLVAGETQTGFDPFGTAVVAWNGSYEAANAVRGALPLLRMASEVRVVRFEEKKDRRFPSTRLLEYLSRQGITAELEGRAEPRAGTGGGLVDYAQACGASTIVIGAYSHSRAGEFLFGGVTRALLKDCPIPLLIAR